MPPPRPSPAAQGRELNVTGMNGIVYGSYVAKGWELSFTVLSNCLDWLII